jgi:hypothetical protein
MYAKALLVLTLSALSSALPASTKRDATCMSPSQFTIRQFAIFTPAAGNPHASNLAFKFGDDNYNTECSSNITSNPTSPLACDNSNVQWEWDGKNTLTIGETYTPCNS